MYFSPAHNYDVGLECETLVSFLKESVYWSGIYFSPLNSSKKDGNSSLEHVEIVNAFEGIKASKSAPAMSNVVIKDGFTGMLLTDLKQPVQLVNLSISRCDFVGVNITSPGAPIVMDNVLVENTKHEHGFVYNQIVDAVEFCSVTPKEASFPLVLKVSGNSTENNCSKVTCTVTNDKKEPKKRKCNTIETQKSDTSLDISSQYMTQGKNNIILLFSRIMLNNFLSHQKLRYLYITS